MSRDNGEGVFDMSFITNISKFTDLQDAKRTSLDRVEASTANAKNKDKARALVIKSNSINALIFGMTNFSLSHQGMKTI